MIKRTNMAERQNELWRPVSFSVSTTTTDRLIGRVRRFLDLQTASIWGDLASELANVSGTVLDVGCGAQPYRSLFSDQAVYIGIDSAQASAHFGYKVPDTRYFEGSTWPVDQSSADFILCTETLEHVPDPKLFLLEAFRCLTPGGRILLTVPFAARWHYIPHDYWRFTPAGLKNLLQEAGFRNICVYARGGEITVACYKVMALFLPLLMPQGRRAFTTILLRLVGFLFGPVFVLLAIIGNVSLRGDGGDDCLGYTALAGKPQNT
jgi:SAM-dependent methyltransferase